MATGPENYVLAEELLEQGLDLEHYIQGVGHAILALAAATSHALPSGEWQEVAQARRAKGRTS